MSIGKITVKRNLYFKLFHAKKKIIGLGTWDEFRFQAHSPSYSFLNIELIINDFYKLANEIAGRKCSVKIDLEFFKGFLFQYCKMSYRIS